MSTHAQRLRELLGANRAWLVPGGFDAFSALLIEEAGFEAMYLSGASLAYTKLGRPDLGFLGLTDVADALGTIRDRTELPIIVDADTGFGNALNVARTVRTLEQRGASAIQLEDQQLPKRCGHLPGKTLVSTSEMIGKLHAATDARDGETVIVARTDAVAVEGVDAAIERAARYVEAGADLLFVEAPRHRDQLARIGAELGPRCPLLANMVEGGATPPLPLGDLESLGFSIVIYPGAMVRALAFAGRRFLASLQEHGHSGESLDSMLDFGQLNALLGTPELMTLSERYDDGDA